MARRQKQPRVRTSDEDLIGRLQDEAPEVLAAEVDFDAAITKIPAAYRSDVASKRREPNAKLKTKPKAKSRRDDKAG
jgi:hypothetical protein